MQSDDFVIIAAVVKTHGIKGEIKAIPIDTNVERFRDLDEIYLGDEKQKYAIEGFKDGGKFAILKLENIDSIEEANKLIKKNIYSVLSKRPKLDEDSFYVSDLINMTVKDSTTESIGKVKDIETYPANDVLVCKFDGQIARIPMKKEFIKQINLEEKIIYVETISGMIE